MSSIIKAEYVVYNDKSKSTVDVGIIKQPQVIENSKEDLYEAYNQREVILEEAKQEALKIVNNAKRNAQKEIAENKQKAYEEGYNAGLEIGKDNGYKEGYELGTTKITEELEEKNRSKLQELTEMIEIVEKEKETIISDYENGLSKLAIDIAEKIIRQRLSASDNVIVEILKGVIKDYRNTDWIKIYISNKDDAITVQGDKLLINELNKISNNVKIEVKEELEFGSVILETPDGVVDAGVNTQLNNLKEMVLRKNAV